MEIFCVGYKIKFKKISDYEYVCLFHDEISIFALALLKDFGFIRLTVLRTLSWVVLPHSRFFYSINLMTNKHFEHHRFYKK